MKASLPLVRTGSWPVGDHCTRRLYTGISALNAYLSQPAVTASITAVRVQFNFSQGTSLKF